MRVNVWRKKTCGNRTGVSRCREIGVCTENGTRENIIKKFPQPNKLTSKQKGDCMKVKLCTSQKLFLKCVNSFCTSWGRIFKMKIY